MNSRLKYSAKIDKATLKGSLFYQVEAFDKYTAALRNRGNLEKLDGLRKEDLSYINIYKNQLSLKEENKYLIAKDSRLTPKQENHLPQVLSNKRKKGNTIEAITGHRTRTRLRLSILIMASTVWWTWCSSVDNCLVFAAEQSSCPEDCLCFSNFKDVFCDANNLRSIPPEIPSTVETLTLSNNNLRDLNRNALQRLASLKDLKLDDNRISELPNNIFYGTQNLQKLDLSGNKLKRVPKYALGYLQNLRELILRNNPITRILSFDFITHSETLLSLDLGELRHLSIVSPRALEGLQNVQTLNMDNCNLLEIPNLQTLSSLRQVDVSSNKLKTVEASMFTGLYHLEEISLDYCDIATIQDGAFSHLQLLESINLASNNITTMKASLFDNCTNLRTLDLRVNPWVCNCNLLSLSEYIYDNFPCSGDECAFCAFPSMYNSVPIKNLASIEDPPCAAPLVKTEAQNKMNVSVGSGVKIPCPTLSPEEESEVEKVQWIMPNGRFIHHGRYTMRIKKLDDGALNFTKVTLRDTGVYTCSVTKRSSEVSNSTVYLNVTGSIESVLSTFTTVTTLSTRPGIVYPPVGNLPKTPPTTEYTKQTKISRKTTKSRPIQTTTITSTVKPDERIVLTSKPFVTTSSFKPIPPPRLNDQSSATTTIIIGCFIGLTLLAALLLLIFYRIRKRTYSSSQDECEDEKEDQYEMNGRPYGSKSFENNQPNSKPSTEYTNLSPHHTESANSIHDRTAHEATNIWLANLQSQGNLPASAIHVLPPPPEELLINSAENRNPSFPSQLYNIKEIPSKDSSIPMEESRIRPQRLTNGHVSKDFNNVVGLAKTSNQKPLKHSFGNHLPKQMLNELALSCQEVALKRRSDGNYDLSREIQRNDFNKQGVKKNIDKSLCRKSCVSLQQQAPVDNWSCADEGIILSQDIDFSTTKLSKGQLDGINASQKSQEKLNGRSKRKIPIKVKNLEGLLEHKETEI